MKNFALIALLVVVVLAGAVWFSNSRVSKDSSVISANGLHWHPELDIYIKGEKVEIPENVGLTGVHSPVHTHEDLPIIHLEFEGIVREDDLRLGNFFSVWGREFNSNQIFEYQNGSEGTVKMFVNGEENTEFENYQMRDGDKIEIRYE